MRNILREQTVVRSVLWDSLSYQWDHIDHWQYPAAVCFPKNCQAWIGRFLIHIGGQYIGLWVHAGLLAETQLARSYVVAFFSLFFIFLLQDIELFGGPQLSVQRGLGKLVVEFFHPITSRCERKLGCQM